MIQRDVSLKNMLTFGLEIYSKLFIRINSTITLDSLWKSTVLDLNHPLILGGGSNMLFLKDYAGLVIKNEIVGKKIINENSEFVWLEIGGGENWHQLVLFCVAQNWGGIENLSLIPGTVGAAPIQNIGAYGVELESVFHSLTAWNLKSGKTKVFDKESCQFGYRQSIFKEEEKGNWMITNVVLKLSKKPQVRIDYGDIQHVLQERKIDKPNIEDVSKAVIQIRQSKLPDPAVLGNCGSFFKNPIVNLKVLENIIHQYPTVKYFKIDEEYVKIPAGWLIETAGWKGKRIANVGMHEKQALVLINYGNATGSELKNHALKVQADIKEKFNIDLEAEVNYIE